MFLQGKDFSKSDNQSEDESPSVETSKLSQVNVSPFVIVLATITLFKQYIIEAFTSNIPNTLPSLIIRFQT